VTPSVSVIVPVFNGERFLAEAIASAVGQTFEDLEVIVVDDGSTDATPAIIAGFGDRIRWARQANEGVAAARNRGHAMARGRYVAFLDADDVWLPEKIERQVACVETGPRFGAVGCGLFVTDERLNIRGRIIPSPCTLSDLLLFRGNGGLNAGTVLFRKAAIDEVGGFDPDLFICEDLDLAIRVMERAEVTCLAEPLMLYRQHGANIHGQLRRWETNLRRMLDRTFARPRWATQADLHRESFSRMYMMLAGSYWQAGEVRHAIRCGLLGVRWNPRSATRLLNLLHGRPRAGR
jgi:glycosyltransferase involved in cell wall biosynthesis